MKLEGNGLVFKKLKRGTRSSENDRNFTTLNKEIQLYSTVLFICVLNSTPHHLKFFPFSLTTLPICNSFIFSAQLFQLVSMISLAWFLELQIMFFFRASIQRRHQLLCQLQNDMKKGTSPSSNGWDFIPNIDGWDEVLMWEVMTDDHRIGIIIF